MTAYHIPALLKESVAGLNIRPEGVYVDVTYGGGGHSREIIRYLKKGKVYAFDQDEDAARNAIKDDRFRLIRSNFRYIKNFMRYYQVDKVDGIIADLGISFHQVDEPGRGFSFRSDEKIDMRMNKSAAFSAENILNEYETKQLASILKEYGELDKAWQIAQTIVKERDVEKISTTGRLVEVLGKFVPRNQENKFFAKVFQALRIEVNHEMESLKEFLLSTLALIKTGGRLVVISYHSTEDRLVKNFMKSGNFEGHIEKDLFGNYSVPFRIINKKVIVPDQEEINMNPRSRSAKLRIVEKY